MKVYRSIAYLLLVVMAFSITSCIEYKEVQVVEVSDVGIKDISMSGIDVQVSMQVKNPNKYDISIVDSDLTLFADGNKVGVAKVKEKIKLKKKSNKIYKFTIQTSAADIMTSAMPVLMSVMTKSHLGIRIKGDIKAKAKGVGKRFPVDFTEKVKL
jgi:LEA14-like dessication related protein